MRRNELRTAVEVISQSLWCYVGYTGGVRCQAEVPGSVPSPGGVIPPAHSAWSKVRERTWPPPSYAEVIEKPDVTNAGVEHNT